MSTTNPTVKELLAKMDKQQQDILNAIAKISVPTPSPVPSPTPNPVPTGEGLYVPKTQLSVWLENHKSDPNYNLLKTKIADKPTCMWLNGSQSDIDLVKKTMEECGKTIPCFVLYAIPDRDAQQYSAGGFKSVDDYYKWVGGIGWAVQQTNKPCVFIIEPDALGLLNDRPTTYPCINAAIDILRKNSNTKIFVEAATWISPNDMAGRVKGAGVERANGIAVNTSGRNKTADMENYSKEVLKNLKTDLQYIIDVSRNGGNTPAGEWCNPIGEKLGTDPKIINNGQAYAHAWIKIPGELDGGCGQFPNGKAGELSIEAARLLAS